MAEASTDKRIGADDCDEFDSDVIRILVGSSRKSFMIHERVLRHNSEFFDAALKKEWAESRDREVKLPEEDPVVFRRYLQYLYSGAIACKGDGTDIRAEYETLARMYALGERMLDGGFRDAILNAIIATTEDQHSRNPDSAGTTYYPGAIPINIIYESTTEYSPARRLLVDLYVVHAGLAFKFEVNGVKAHPTFLIDVARAFAARRSVPREVTNEFTKRTRGSACAYHNHETGEPCGPKRQKRS